MRDFTSMSITFLAPFVKLFCEKHFEISIFFREFDVKSLLLFHMWNNRTLLEP